MGILRRATALSTALSLVATLACSGKSGTGTTPKTGTTKEFAPLTVATEAKAKHQAVILGTDEKNGSTIIPLPTTATEGTVDAMWVKMGGADGPSGGSTPVNLKTEPNAKTDVQVLFGEDKSGGAGSQWRAGAWVAAFVAANTLGKDLTDFQFLTTSKGHIDGASASGLMSGGFLATITGEKIDPTATMTGIINPDGTIGPVGGIPEKFKGSIEKGKKRLGYPIGLRHAKSAATGELVDLVQLARDSGAEAVEIANVQDAYELLTKKTLPVPVPVAERDMRIDDAVSKAIEVKYKEWQDRLSQEWSALLQLGQSGRLPQLLILIARRAQASGEQAQKYYKQGLVVPAYNKMLEAWVFAASATDTYDILNKIQRGDIEGASKAVAALDELDQTANEVFKKIAEVKPATLGKHLLLMSAFQSALRGWASKMHARSSVRQTKAFVAGLADESPEDLASPDVAEQLVARVAPTVLAIGRSISETIVAAQRLEFEAETSINYSCSIPMVLQMATSFESASAAGVQYFDTLLVEPMARQSGMPLDYVRNIVAMREPDYLVSLALSRLSDAEGLPAELKKEWGEKSVYWGLMSLAGNELAYYKAGELIAKYYSLNIKTDYTGRVSSVEHEKAFQNMITSAERSSRASARAARIATGSIPIQAKLAYQNASVLREGDINDKIQALAAYWSSTAFSNTAVALARNPKVAK